MTTRRIESELKEMQENPIMNCSAGPVGNDVFEW